MVIMTIQLKNPVTGQEIMRAVEDIADEDYRKEVVQAVDNKVWYRVGQGSRYPEMDVAISVGPTYSDPAGHRICPQELYRELAVVNWMYDGLKSARPVTDEDVIDGVMAFRDKLKELLNKAQNRES